MGSERSTLSDTHRESRSRKRTCLTGMKSILPVLVAAVLSYYDPGGSVSRERRQAHKGQYVVLKNSENCWKTCGKGNPRYGGPCPVCGRGAYCCKHTLSGKCNWKQAITIRTSGVRGHRCIQDRRYAKKRTTTTKRKTTTPKPTTTTPKPTTTTSTTTTTTTPTTTTTTTASTESEVVEGPGSAMGPGGPGGAGGYQKLELIPALLGLEEEQLIQPAQEVAETEDEEELKI